MKREKKKMIFKIIMSIVIVFVIAGGILGIRIYQLSQVTTGERISANLASMSALLVLDVQNDTLGIKEYDNTDYLMENINSSIRYAKDNNIDIIYTKQEFTNPIDKLISGGLYQKESDGSELSSHLEVLSANIYGKEKTDAFSNSELETYLLKKKITTLYIVGADASACVYKTSLGAKRRGYEVIILEDAIFSVNNKLLNTAKENYENAEIKIITLSDFVK